MNSEAIPEAIPKAKPYQKPDCQHDWFQYWHDCDSELLCGVDECQLCHYAKTDCGLIAESENS